MEACSGLNLYQKTVKETCFVELRGRDRKMLFAIGLGGECGELLEIIKKGEFHRKNKKSVFHQKATRAAIKKEVAATKAAMKAEAGDVLWYLTNLLTEYDLSLDEVVEHNRKKALMRYEQKRGAR